ncbi:hypothetical protein BDC45DRAFT_586463 [Circinella umbellata]|nr:hypothetical protein BDC45DRAFT_586463 [Circinella umbellata]
MIFIRKKQKQDITDFLFGKTMAEDKFDVQIIKLLTKSILSAWYNGIFPEALSDILIKNQRYFPAYSVLEPKTLSLYLNIVILSNIFIASGDSIYLIFYCRINQRGSTDNYDINKGATDELAPPNVSLNGGIKFGLIFVRNSGQHESAEKFGNPECTFVVIGVLLFQTHV